MLVALTKKLCCDNLKTEAEKKTINNVLTFQKYQLSFLSLLFWEAAQLFPSFFS